MQLAGSAEKQIMQGFPDSHFPGEDEVVEGAKAFAVPLCELWKTT